MAIDVLLYDAYGTLWDVHSVMKRCEACWPGKGMQVSQLWRVKQLEATWLPRLRRRRSHKAGGRVRLRVGPGPRVIGALARARRGG